ncbi:type II and III secretion system protein [Rhodocaloribacter litoris]|nr:type II and III secretion system protein [Rhodocaloribacter litoris]
MKKMRIYLRCGHAVLGLALLAGLLAAPLHAQDRPPERVIRAYIPPDQLVSFLPSTPFDRFVDFLNPIFQRVTGKQVIDPDERTHPIGISIAGMHFLDAFELVLQYNGLTFRETDRYFIVEQAPPEQQLVLDAEQATGRATAAPAARQALPASLDTREIQINAILFELDHTRARDIGIDWSVFLGGAGSGQGGQGGQGGSGSGGSGNQSGQGGRNFILKTDDLFGGIDDLVQAPQEINFRDLNQFFRLAEQQGVGETIASPNVTVQSGEKGRIQIGTDVPVQVRDFAGNTVTQFFSTGIIVDVTPTLIEQPLADTAGAPTLEFIHLDVKVEKSGSSPSASGPIIDRNTATTRVLLLDGEQTVIGGLYSTDERVSRTGIPILKDLPGWFFGLRYIFGRTQRSTTQKELLIVLQARVLEPLEARAGKPFRENLLDEQRQKIRDALRQFNNRVGREVRMMDKYRMNTEQD